MLKISEKELSNNSIHIIVKFIKNSFRTDSNGTLSLFDEELNGTASDCSTLQIAAFLAWIHNAGLCDEGLTLSRRLFHYVYMRRRATGWFAIPYNVPLDGVGNVDLAEFGASATSVLFLTENVDIELGTKFFSVMEERISEFESKERLGAYRKNDSSTSINVLNGDIYASLVLALAYKVTGRTTYSHKLNATINHLVDRFNFEERQWPYSEYWTGDTCLGMSVAYQATITGWGRSLLPILSGSSHDQFREVLILAEGRMLEELRSGRTSENESPSWVSEWEQVWEIWQSLLWCQDTTFATLWIESRIEELENGLSEFGINFFNEKRLRRNKRSIIGSKMRTTANLMSILMNANRNRQIIK